MACHGVLNNRQLVWHFVEGNKIIKACVAGHKEPGACITTVNIPMELDQ